MRFTELITCAVVLARWGRTANGTETAGTADPPPPRGDELRRFLLALPPTALYLLATVAYLGGSKYRPGHLLELMLGLSRTLPTRAAVVEVLARWRPLAEHLTAGLKKLTAARVNLDKLHAG